MLYFEEGSERIYFSILKDEISTQHFQNLQVSVVQNSLIHGVGELCSSVTFEKLLRLEK